MAGILKGQNDTVMVLPSWVKCQQFQKNKRNNNNIIMDITPINTQFNKFSPLFSFRAEDLGYCRYCILSNWAVILHNTFLRHFIKVHVWCKILLSRNLIQFQSELHDQRHWFQLSYYLHAQLQATCTFVQRDALGSLLFLLQVLMKKSIDRHVYIKILQRIITQLQHLISFIIYCFRGS